VAEQLRFEQIRRERRSVERDESLVRARAVPMQRASNELFTRTGFARDQHRHARTRQPTDRTEDFLHRRRLTEHLRNAPCLAHVVVRAYLLFGGTPHQIDGLIDVERLRQIFECAALIGRDGTVQVRMRGHHDDGQLRLAVADLAQQIESAASRHAHVGDQHIGPIAS